jgi:dimethylaniline monooxygenase (N-oxide forming)
MSDYAKHFSLYKHFRFNTEIQLISPLGTTATKANIGDRAERGVAASEGNVGWEIRLRDPAGQRVETFDKVLVTSGPWSRPYTPTVPGLEDFRGQIVHSQAFKT